MNTPMTEQELLQVDNTYNVQMWEAVERLRKNEDFQKVILEGYLQKRAVDGVSMLATQHVIQNGLRSQVMESLIAISHLEDYLLMIESLGNIPPEDFEDEESEEG